ncbi:DsbA family protein [Caulobacter sp. KR2-114]|uniref:DsbA family protein n=1 Tax=Caulobacter sp. KR2-114 TaxID=3400912 RepID=UPI003C2DBED6
MRPLVSPLRWTALALAGAAALALGACQKTDDAAFGAKVRAYLLAHPEVLREAAQKLDEQDQAKATAQAREALAKAAVRLPQFRQQLEHDPADFVANPNGKITVTEFYDYRCPHCVNAAPRVMAMIKANPDVRFVFKEQPIFGDLSERAARAALAVKKDGGDYVGAYAAMMAAHGALDADVIDKIAVAHGAKAATLQSAAFQQEANAHLAATDQLFRQLGMGGTPSFVIGDEVVPGEDVDAVLQAVNQQRTRLAGT